MQCSINAKGNLVVEIELDQTGNRSQTGKTTVHASTHGNVKTGVTMQNGKELTLGLNAYTK